MENQKKKNEVPNNITLSFISGATVSKIMSRFNVTVTKIKKKN